jgi:hypothetical protein
MSKPICVSAFKITESLPESLQSSLPTIEELESLRVHSSQACCAILDE